MTGVDANHSDAWFEEIYQETAPVLMRCARAFVRVQPALKDEIDDLIQETYIRMYNKRAELQNHEAIIKWLVVTLRNLTSNRLRVQKTRNKHIAWEIDQDNIFDNVFADARQQVEAALDNDDLELLHRIAGHIGDDKLELLQQYYLDKVPLKELAEREGISPEAMKMRISRLRKKCTEVLFILLLLETLLLRGYIHKEDEGYDRQWTAEVLLRAGGAHDNAEGNEQRHQ